MDTGVKVEAWGAYALFTRPEMKLERVSYDMMTPSAARGILESVYWHPGMRWVVDKIHVLSPVRFVGIERNEVKSKASSANAWAAMQGDKRKLSLVASKDRTQKTSLFLKDVHYVIEAHFELTPKRAPSDNERKFMAIFTRRLAKGQCYSQPYFGCRECTAFVRPWPDGKEIPKGVSRDLGVMLYDMDYSKESIPSLFFHAKLEEGTLDLEGVKPWAC